jgi:hypothetical protein
MRRMWCRLRAVLRQVVGGGARDAELSEELRAFVELDMLGVPRRITNVRPFVS